MKNFLNSIRVERPKRNVFDLSHDHKTTGQMGFLIPTACIDCLPGETYTLGCESVVRLMPLVAPVMHRFDVTQHYWFVPKRLLWDKWDDYMNPNNLANLPAHPYIVIQNDGSNYTKLMDYFGIPDPTLGRYTSSAPEAVNALQFAAYQFIYNEMYRDQNLITELVYKCVDGDNTANTALTVLRKRAWEHDLFTSCLPTPQAGASVDLPLGDVVLDENWSTIGTDPGFVNDGTPNIDIAGTLSNNGVVTPGVEASSSPGTHLAYDPRGTLQVAPTTVNELRRAFALQRWLELAVRGGKRFAEIIRNYFNVTPKDERLQRPEYITGTQVPIAISEVLNTTGTVERPQGDMAGHGVSVMNGQKYGRYTTSEHGFIISIVSVRPKTAYEDGIPKQFTKTSTPLEHYWPQFAHLGEQPVQRRELMGYTGSGTTTFGYMPAYYEYRMENNKTSGDFRDTLSHWHAGRQFSSAPSLNQLFIECDAADNAERIFAVQDPTVDNIVLFILHKIMAVRPIPKYGTPALY